jgi:hypothetical protein
MRANSEANMISSLRTIRFPHRRSLGNLYVAQESQPEEWELLSQVRGLIVSPENQPIKWEWLEEARGTVQVPASSKLKLKLSADGARSLSALSNIDEFHALDLSNSPITNSSLECISGLHTLRVLELTSTKIGDDGLYHIRKLTKLQSLGLSYSQVSSNGLAHLKNLVSLRDLWLSSADVDDDSLAYLRNLGRLVQLGLTGTKLTDRGLDHLVHMDLLLRLYLFNTKVTQAGADALRKRLPHCRIKWNPSAKVPPADSSSALGNSLISGAHVSDDVSDSETYMNHQKFWQIIDLFDWDKTPDDRAVIEPAIQALAVGSIEDIYKFSDILSENLYKLDGERFAREIGQGAYKGKDHHFSGDWFLQVRCCVVANGKDFYKDVLAHPNQMPKDLEFGALLAIPSKAYERKTGKQFTHIAKYDYETFGNGSGWAKRQ